ncbi:MAG TPA: sodium:solute symporter [Chthoniobacterales bacterium]
MAEFLPDFLVIFAYFTIIISIGLAQKGKSGSVEGFALGNREIAWWAVLASIIAAEISAATFLGAPGEGFEKRNWTYAQLAIGTVLARILVSVVFIPIYYKQGVISIYEFLGTRFGRRTRTFASCTFLVTRVLAMGTRLYVSAIIVVLGYEMVSGMNATPADEFWLFTVALVLISLMTAVYTTVGGIRAVIWTDFIQVTVLVAALGFSVWFLLGKIHGGWDAVVSHIQEPVFWNWGQPKGDGVWGWVVGILSEEYTVWAAIIGSTFVTMATHGIDQDTVQRMLTAKNRQQSAFATIMSGIVDVPIVASFILIGVLLSIYYAGNTDPNLPKEGREIFPYFILHVMPQGLRGLVAAGILATAMGSLSTALNALATSFSRDFVIPRMTGEITEQRRVRALRLSTILFATLIIAVGVTTAWYVSHHPSVRIIPLVLGILGYTFGSLLGVFLVGVFTRNRGNDFGNIVGMILGFLVVAYLSGVDLMILDTFAPLQEGTRHRELILAFPWRITCGCLVTVIVALLFPTRERRDERVEY